MYSSVFVAAVVFIAASLAGNPAVASSWTRRGIGAVSCACPGGASSLFVASEKGTAARIRASDGFEEWILPPTLNGERIVGLAYDEPAQVVLTHVFAGDDQSTGSENAREADRTASLQAIDSLSGSVLWAVPLCAFGSVTLSSSCFVSVSGCTDEAIILGLRSGDRVGADYIANCESSSVSDFSVVGRHVCGRDTWNLPGGVLKSEASGRLEFYSAVEQNFPLWSREEGIAHPQSAAFYRKFASVARVLVVLSELGGIFGLDVDGWGQVLWSVDIGDVLRKQNVCRKQLLKGHPDRVVVVVLSEESGVYETVVVVLSASDGAVLDTHNLPNYRAVDAALQGSPTKPQCVSLMSSDGDEERIWCGSTVSSENPGKTRFLVESRGDKVLGVEGGVVQWEMRLPLLGRVLAVAGHSLADPFTVSSQAAPVRVTGTRELLFKYMNPATTLVLSENGKSTSDGVARAKGISATILNADTGAVLDSVQHSGAVGPVAAIRSENWFVYSFWNSDELEQELHVVDLYESHARPPWMLRAIYRYAVGVLMDLTPQALRPRAFNFWDRLGELIGVDSGSSVCSSQPGDVLNTCQSDLGSLATHSAQEGFDGSLPRVVRTSYLVTHPVNTLGATVSERGATDKSVLLGLASGRLVQLPRMILDPRRPKRQSESFASEMLFKYFPVISLWPSQFGHYYLNDGEAVSGLLGEGGIITSPVGDRESTYHFAAIGTDLIYGKSAPAGEFDALSPEFGYYTVLGSVFVLFWSVLATHRAHQKKILDDLWMK